MKKISRMSALLLEVWMLIAGLAACANPNGGSASGNTSPARETNVETQMLTTTAQPGSTEAPTNLPELRRCVSDFPAGRIYLYGEYHSDKSYLDRELALWGAFYQQGMRDLLTEDGYCDTALLNRWMQAEDDEILLRLYDNDEGTQSHSTLMLDFYRTIKENYPETVFHSFDVEHQYDSTGEWYLSLLREEGREDTEEYRLALEGCEQGKTYYELLYSGSSEVAGENYRENCMTENLVRAFEQNGCVSVMAIAGAAHCEPEGVAWGGTVPCMANQLVQKYGRNSLVIPNLKYDFGRMDSLQIGEKNYRANRLGTYCAADFGFDYDAVIVWKSEMAYEDYCSSPRTDLLVPTLYLPVEDDAQAVYILGFLEENETKMDFLDNLQSLLEILFEITSPHFLVLNS